jgi:hypothetical protein
MTHYIVTTQNGDKFQVPCQLTAEETFEVRGGVSIEEIEVTRLRDWGHLFKPAGSAKWQSWPAWKEAKNDVC